MARDLLTLEEATERLRPFASRYVGIRPIPVAGIVGTDSRVGDFDRDFRARRQDVRERRRRVEQAFPDGNFPPIVVYKLGDAYFVIDGHHRVAVARQQRSELIDAEVTELTARWHLPADADPDRARPRRAGADLHGRERTGGRPAGAPIRFSGAVGYVQLLETIQVHGYKLLVEGQRPLDRSGIALDWYSRIYLPTVELLQDERL